MRLLYRPFTGDVGSNATLSRVRFTGYSLGFVSGTFPVISVNSLLKFLLLNESPFSGHLWYLGAVLYTQITVYIVEKHRLTKVLYLVTPVLLIIDIVLGKYSIILFSREFDYILVRNWIFVGIPFFSIGMLLRETRYRIGWWGIPVFILTTILERFLLVRNGLNATRDQYISTTFLAISVMSFALEYKGNVNDRMAKIGQKYSAWLYIIHPIFVTCFTYMASKIGMQKVWGYTGVFVIFAVSLVSVAVLAELKSRLLQKN